MTSSSAGVDPLRCGRGSARFLGKTAFLQQRIMHRLLVRRRLQTPFANQNPLLRVKLRSQGSRGYALPARPAIPMLSSTARGLRTKRMCGGSSGLLLPFKLVKGRRRIARIELVEKGPVLRFRPTRLAGGVPHGPTFADHAPNVGCEALEITRHRIGGL